jgi:hypothetical protein
MKTINKLHLALALAAAMLTTGAIAGPGGGSPADFPVKITTKAEAMSCCVPKARVALACPDCKTLAIKKGEDKKGILAWFAPDSKHACDGCGGKITVKAGEKSGTAATYKHVCSKCSKDSPYVCTDHKAA